jgi:hypothetical protein
VLVYADYFGTVNRSSSCSLIIDGVGYGVENIEIASAGTLNYNLSCSHASLDSVWASGTLRVYGEQIFVDAYRFSPINLTFVGSNFDYDSECGPCTVYVNTSSYTPSSGGSYCEVAIPAMELGRYNSTISCLGHDFNLTVQDARILWDRPEVLGRLWVEDRSGFDGQHLHTLWIGAPKSATYLFSLNDTGSQFNGTHITDPSFGTNSNIYRYSGDLYNNGSTIEIVN